MRIYENSIKLLNDPTKLIINNTLELIPKFYLFIDKNNSFKSILATNIEIVKNNVLLIKDREINKNIQRLDEYINNYKIENKTNDLMFLEDKKKNGARNKIK